jgi:hypothetical protein
VSITSPLNNDSIKGSFVIEVDADDPDGEEDIAWVEFYNEWHKIGQSNEAPFSFTWKQPVYGDANISAKVVDKRGFSATSDTVKVEIKPADYNVTIEILDSLSSVPVQNCTVEIDENQAQTDSSGMAVFEKVSGLLNIHLQKEGYLPKTIGQLSIYSDTILTFSLTPLKNQVTVVVMDERTNELLQWADVTFNGDTKQTNAQGETFFSVYNGDYSFIADKSSFLSESGTLNVSSDTVFYIFLSRTEAEIKFVLKEETTPVNKAVVVLNNDTLISNSIGIARFTNLSVNTSYSYEVSKEGYRTITDTFFLLSDTAVSIAMQKIPVGIEEYNTGDELKLWPNPSTGKIYIKAGKIISKVEIVTLSGIAFRNYLNVMDNELTISFPDILKGYYLVRVYYSDGLTEIREIIVS